MNKVVASALATMFLAGCASSSPKGDQGAISSFQPGVTTVAQAESALGQPFQITQTPDGGQQLQYVTKHNEVSGEATTGSHVPKHVEKTVSTMLSFDQNGHFVRSWSNSSAQSNQGPSDLGNLNQGDIPMTQPGK
ncbi:hypothetical protein [Dyella sp. 2HG41-7]|uniref:hypothetical protein n=1 Tax=Dyella sp. 2HG41-7 TaxID=2883239 RepID=UPI001F246CCC|nr:hypothetical protein [Dyella sp. 2HG41-7]